MEIKAPRGTLDVLPSDSWQWKYVEKIAHETAESFGFQEIRFPTFESTELFQRGVGDTTDVVQKEMYTFQDKGERFITLRPEGTASVARVCLEHGLFGGLLPLKLYYLISAFRYEKPQAGRYREFHQFGTELYGTALPQADVEVILLACSFLNRLGLNDYILKINSIGCPKCRAAYQEKLRSYFGNYESELCETCRSRLNRNPMRILDCKSPICHEIAVNAPLILDSLCDDCKLHFAQVKDLLTQQNISFEVNPYIVRGLDYYTRTVFELTDRESSLALAGGGRYDGLIEELDGKTQMCGLGFAAGLERLISVMNKRDLFPRTSRDGVYFIGLGDRAQAVVSNLVYNFRDAGIHAEMDISGRSFKAQMKYADKNNSKYVIVLGDNEIESDCVNVKDLDGNEPFEISVTNALQDFISKNS